MQYVGNVIRPPSEANSIILQVTVGCSYNKCTFCGAYKDICFSVKSFDTVQEDLEFAARHCKHQRRLFLADGDVLILSQKKLIALLDAIRATLPWINRISLYGNARAVRQKTVEDLVELKDKGLDRVYLGLESGSDLILRSVKKGETAQTMIDAAKKVKEAGLFLSVTALLGLGGVLHSKTHSQETGRVLRRMSPNQIALLTLMPLDNTPLGNEVKNSLFTLPDPEEILLELDNILKEIKEVRCQFHANHASTYLPLAGRLPKDWQMFRQIIAEARSGAIQLTPEHRRAL